MIKTLNISLILIILFSFISVPIKAGGYDIKFEVVSTSPIGATVRATIDGSPKDVQMVVLNLDDIRNGVPPEKARQQEIKYSEVNKITTETVEQKTPIMGERDINIDDVLAKVSAPIEEESKEPVYSKSLVTYLESVKVANTTTSKVGRVDTVKLSTAVSSKSELTKTLVSKELQPEIDKIMADMSETITDVVDYDVKQVEQEVKTSIMTSKVVSESKIFDVSDPMVLEATVTSGGWEDKERGWGASGVVALVIDGVYYYDMSHSSWYSTAYAHRLQFTTDKTNATDNVTNFPVKLWLSDNSTIGYSGINSTALSSFFNAMSYSDRLKIAVTDSTNANQYYVEIVSNSTDWGYRFAEMYTAIPISKTDNLTYNLYYDSSQSANTTYVGDTTSAAAKAVWDSNFVAVYHMNDGSDTGHIYDSTTNVNHGTKKGANEPIVTDELKGKGQNFDGIDDYITLADIDTTDTTIDWVVNIDTYTGVTYADVIAKGLATYSGRSWTSTIRNTNFYFFVRKGDNSGYNYPSPVATPLSTATDYCISDVIKSSDYIKRYKNGSEYSTLNIAGVAYPYQSNYVVTLGETSLDRFDGVLSEVRLSNIARTPAWIKLTNSSERDTLISWSAETSISVPSVTTDAASSITATTATLNENVTSAGNGDLTVHGFQWGNTPSTYNLGDWNESGTSTGTFNHGITSLPTGTTIYFRAYATNQAGTGYGSEETLLTIPAAPTGVSATDGTQTGYVTVSWSASTGATSYNVFRDSTDLGSQTSPFNDTGASAGTITSGTSSASDGSSPTIVSLSLAGQSTSNGTSYTYTVKASNGSGQSSSSSGDTGYRGVGSLTYQWYRSAADSDASYSTIGGATTASYDDTAGVADPNGRYYKCYVSATGATSQYSTADRGYMTAVITNPFAPTNFKATASGNNIVLSFTKGSGATNTVILRGDNRYPTSITDGTIVDNTTGTSVTDTNQNSEIATKYYSAWSLDNSTGLYSLTYATTQGGATVMLMAVIIALIALVVGIFVFARG